MSTAADERRWREAMEKLGVENVRSKLSSFAVGTALDTPIMGNVDDAPHPPRRFVEAWLAKKEAAGHKYRVRVDILALILGALGVVLGLAALLK
jgi:hypothetical protein